MNEHWLVHVEAKPLVGPVEHMGQTVMMPSVESIPMYAVCSCGVEFRRGYGIDAEDALSQFRAHRFMQGAEQHSS